MKLNVLLIRQFIALKLSFSVFLGWFSFRKLLSSQFMAFLMFHWDSQKFYQGKICYKFIYYYISQICLNAKIEMKFIKSLYILV